MWNFGSKKTKKTKFLLHMDVSQSILNNKGKAYFFDNNNRDCESIHVSAAKLEPKTEASLLTLINKSLIRDDDQKWKSIKISYTEDVSDLFNRIVKNIKFPMKISVLSISVTVDKVPTLPQ